MEEIVIKLPNELKFGFASKLISEALVRLVKQDISERFKQTRKVTDEDWEFCEAIDWHPVDELPMKPEHIEELERAEKGPFIKFDSAEELFRK